MSNNRIHFETPATNVLGMWGNHWIDNVGSAEPVK